MRLQKRLAAALLIFVLAVPAYAAPDREGLFDRFAKLIKRVLLRLPVSSGDGVIPPLPDPPKP